MGTLPYEYDRVMGVTSVGSQESERFGEGNDPETENAHETVAHSREETHENQVEDVAQREESPGVGEFPGGARMCESSDSGYQCTLCSCHSEGRARESTPHMTNAPQKGTKIRTKYDSNCFRTRQTRQFCGHIFVCVFTLYLRGWGFTILIVELTYVMIAYPLHYIKMVFELVLN